jgi:hypothetical protein
MYTKRVKYKQKNYLLNKVFTSTPNKSDKAIAVSVLGFRSPLSILEYVVLLIPTHSAASSCVIPFIFLALIRFTRLFF